MTQIASKQFQIKYTGKVYKLEGLRQTEVLRVTNFDILP
jgi:hypothetical protein